VRKLLDSKEIVRKEKIKLIGNILDLYIGSVRPDTSKPYWYGDLFDDLYEKDILELRVTLTVYEQTRYKKYL
jgi:hypothetical protein